MSIWRRLFRASKMDAELDEELRVHLSMAQRDRVDRGESEADAGVNARREFGNALLVKETTRDMWGWTALENVTRDLRHALRQLKRALRCRPDLGLPVAGSVRAPYTANYRFASADYWRALGVPLRQGRYLEERDYDRNVVVVSEKVVALLWPGENPLGKHLRMLTLVRNPGGFEPKRLPGGGIDFHAMEVAGVVADTREGALNREPPAVVYAPYRFQAVGWGAFVLRTQGDPATAISQVRVAIAKEDPEMPLTPAETMEEILDRSVAVRRFEMNLAAAFGVAALALASLGIYGVISFAVARRTSELGIRIALGASTGKLMASVLRQGMTPVLLGLAAGLAASLMLGRLIASQLYGISASDPLTISTVTGLLLLVAAGACWMPARRAARVDPVRTLRFE